MTGISGMAEFELVLYRMFCEPEPIEVKRVMKTDPTAPARSTIRRQRSVRYPSRYPRDQPPPSRLRSHRHHDRFLEAMSRHEIGVPPSAERAIAIEVTANQAHAEASRRRRLESGRATLRDALSYEPTRQSTDLPRDHSYALSMMRPPLPSSASPPNPSRRSRQRPVIWENTQPRQLSPRLRTGTVRTPPPAYIPSPPYSSGDRSDRSSPDTLQSATRPVSLISRFAPAHALPGINSVTGLARLRHHEENLMGETINDSMTNELPPLRRVSRRDHPFRSHWEVQSETSRNHGVDGLGDRWRSVSPDDESWDTLLSTMPPDERLPSSASTSFRSNEDLAYYESFATVSAEFMAEAIDMYPVHCENTDTELSEAEEILPEQVDASVHELPSQLPTLPNHGLAEGANEESYNVIRTTRDQRRPNRERL